jgi:ribosomal protein S18 acetylase RimI-like enzyme
VVPGETLSIKRSSDASDLEAFLEIVRSYSLTAEERASLEREFGELGGNRLIYVAWEGPHPVGAVQLILRNADNDQELADGGSVAHVHHLRVLHHRQRQGLGRLLMEHVEDEARSLGFRRLSLGVESWNEGAIAFYKRLGFEQLKEADGRTPDEKLYYLKKDLAP